MQYYACIGTSAYLRRYRVGNTKIEYTIAANVTGEMCEKKTDRNTKNI